MVLSELTFCYKELMMKTTDLIDDEHTAQRFAEETEKLLRHLLNPPMAEAKGWTLEIAIHLWLRLIRIVGDRRAPSIQTPCPIRGGLGSFTVFEGSNEESWTMCVLSHADFDDAVVTTSVITTYGCGGCDAVIDEQELTNHKCVVANPYCFLPTPIFRQLTVTLASPIA